MGKATRRFVYIDDGAVTVDWVVLSAAIIGLGMLVLTPVAMSASSSAVGIGDYIKNTEVGYDKN